MDANNYNPKVFDNYRPLRNAMRQYLLEDSLATIKAYSQHLVHKTGFPSDLEPSKYLDVMSLGIKQWELLILAREAIAHSQEIGIQRKSLRTAHQIEMTINKVRNLEDFISSEYINTDNVLLEMHRIAHRQFMWNSALPDHELLIRYYKIFGNKGMQQIVADQIGLDLRTIYIAGLTISGNFLNFFGLNYPPTITTSAKFKLTHKELDVFYKRFSIDIGDLRTKFRDEIKKHMNETYAYYLDIAMNPLIRMDVQGVPSLVAPLPTLLMWRFTRGIYYELYPHRGFDKAFGTSFQDYIGEVLVDLFASMRKARILPEEPTANNRGVSSSDWFLEIDDWLLVIEAKTKRMALTAKINVSDDSALQSELSKLADAVVQTYKCIEAIKSKKLSGKDYRFSKIKQFIPIVVTLEDWYIFGPTRTRLDTLVTARLNSEGIDVNILNTNPYIVASIHDFENLSKAIKTAKSIKKVLDELIANKHLQEYEIYTYLFNQKKIYINKSIELFKGQFQKLIIDAKRN